jgi:hypothetical protein
MITVQKMSITTVDILQWKKHKDIKLSTSFMKRL